MATYTPNPLPVTGDTAHDAVDANNPVKVGGQARTTMPTAVSNADRVNELFDKYGRVIVSEDVPDDLLNNFTQLVITSTTAVQTLLAADSSNRNDIRMLIIANTSATGTEVQILKNDGTTVVVSFWLPPKETRGFVGKLKGEGVGSNAWKVKTVTSVASVKVGGTYASIPG